MNLVIRAGRRLSGETTVPGDKSLSHRAALFAALAEGESQIDNFLVSGVTGAMLDALTGLGVPWRLEHGCLRVSGTGAGGLHSPAAPLDCRNSATTMRLLAGALAGAGTAAVLDGSAGLRRRPMGRIVTPLKAMGVAITAAEGGGAPLALEARLGGRRLRGMEVKLEAASAQVKTCLMLAALAAGEMSTLIEPARSRDHSERMLSAMGAKIRLEPHGSGAVVTILPLERPLAPLNMAVPGDFSAAAFLIVAALTAPGSDVVLRGVGLNPTRTGLLEALLEMGADIQVMGEYTQAGEPVGDLRVRSGRLHGTTVSGERVVAMIDEFPIFAVAAACADGPTEVRDAAELRLKESDRIEALCGELRAQGVAVEERPDGFTLHGQGGIPGGAGADPHGDHRLAMSLAVAGLAAERPIRVRGAEIVKESFPGFPAALRALGAEVVTDDEGQHG